MVQIKQTEYKSCLSENHVNGKKRYVQKIQLVTWKMSLNEKIIKWAESYITKIKETQNTSKEL